MRGGMLMIIKPQKVEVKWNGANRKYYESKGYVFTSASDSFFIDIDHILKSTKSMVKVECDNCKLVFKREYCFLVKRENQNHFCSKVCESIFRKGKSGIKRSKRIITECDTCGKKLELTEYRFNLNKHHFCNSKCANKFSKKDPNKWITCKCEYCGNDYEVSLSQFKHNGSRFCSKKCRNKWESKNKRGKNHHNFNSVLKDCDNCGNKFYVKNYKIENQDNFFCCIECRQEWYANVWSQQDEWKEESRKRAVRILKNNKGTVDTSPQVKVNNLLDKLNIAYKNEYNCIYYSIDNYLTKYDLMIEVMGTYWHSDPRFYNELNYEMQVKRINRDKAKNTYLVNVLNNKILYLWEYDIENNIMLIEKLIKLFIKLHGKLPNFHSFNYELVDNKLILNKSMIIPYMEYEKCNLNIKYLTEPKSRKQKDKWITFNCDYCGKEKEQLISHYNKNKTHCCSRSCSAKLNKQIMSK